MLKKVVIIGPESTGKSTLCEMLAQHYNTQWCPEFAREYLLTNGKAYDFEDLLIIAKGQLALEDEYVGMVPPSYLPIGGKMASEEIPFPNSGLPPTDPQLSDFPTSQLSDFGLPTPNSQLLFIDTDQYVMKVWCEYVFNECHSWILRRIAERPYDLYLLCKPDLPWVADTLREYPDEKPRQELYHMYRDLLIQQHTPWIEVKGSYEERFEQAKEAVAQILN
jgi:nicotinamide riboside kinase